MVEVERTLHYLKVMKAKNNAETNLINRLKSFFGGVFNNVLRNLSRLGRVPSDDVSRSSILSDLRGSIDDMASVVFDEVEPAAQAARIKLINDLRLQGRQLARSTLPSTTVDLLRNQVFVASQSTIRRMTGDVMEVLADSYSKGLSIYDTTRRLESVFEDMRGWELERIARTEIQGSQNLSSYMSDLELGVVYHMWMTALDNRVRGLGRYDRANHIALHGQIVRVGEPFSNGLQFPGDRNAPISEWINCRCFTVPYLMPLGSAAPNAPYFYEGDLISVV